MREAFAPPPSDGESAPMIVESGQLDRPASGDVLEFSDANKGVARGVDDASEEREIAANVATFTQGEGARIDVAYPAGEKEQILAPDQRREAGIPLEAEPAGKDIAIEAKREDAELERAIAEMPEAEREEIGWKLHNIGFQVEKLKSTGLAKGYGWVAEQCKERSMLGRFFGAMQSQFAEKVETTQKQMEDIEKLRKEGKTENLMKQLGNAGYLSGNLLKYGRIVADIAGWTAGAPTRWVTIGAMATGSVLEGTKEARLQNEEVKEETRVADIDKAADEAWAVYEGALQNKRLRPDGEHEGITKEELVKAYQEKIPADILRRLAENPKEGTGATLVQKMFQKHIGWAANRIQKKLDAVDGNATLDAKAKAGEKEAIIARFGRSKMLADFDRILSQEGTIDALAMSARYGEQGAKGIVYGMMADSLYRLWDRFGEAFAGRSWELPALAAADNSPLPGIETEFDDTLGGGEISVAEPQAAGVGMAVAESVMTDEELAAQQEEARAILEGDIRTTPHDVVRGDTLWKIANGNPAVLRLSPDELRAIGVSSGDANLIRVGEKIDTGRLEEFLRQKQELGNALRSVAPQAFVEHPTSPIPTEFSDEEVPEQPATPSDFTGEEPQEVDHAAESERARMALEERFEREREQAIIEEQARSAARMPPARPPEMPIEQYPQRSFANQEAWRTVLGTERFPGGRGYHIEGDSIVPDRRLSELTPRELLRWPMGTPKPWPVTLSEADRLYGNNVGQTRQIAEEFRFKAGRYPNEDEFRLFSKMKGGGINTDQHLFGTLRSGPFSRVQAEEYERMMMRTRVMQPPFDPRTIGRPSAGYSIGEGRGGRPNNPFEIMGGKPAPQSEVWEQHARNIWLEEKIRGNPNADEHLRRSMEQAERMRVQEAQAMRGRAEYERKRAGAVIAKQILGSILRGR